MDENYVEHHSPRPEEMTTHENSGNLGTNGKRRKQQKIRQCSEVLVGRTA